MLYATHKGLPLFITDFETASENRDVISRANYSIVIMVSMSQKKAFTEIFSDKLPYLSLPLRRSQLFSIIRKLMKNENKSAQKEMKYGKFYFCCLTSRNKIEERKSTCTILVVDDNLINQKIMVRMLNNLGNLKR
jgi:hypothetical protein